MTELERRVRRWRSERVRALWLDGSLRFSFLPASVLLLACALDRAYSLPQGLRWGIFLGGAAAFVSGALAFLLLPWLRLSVSEVLEGALSRHPALRSVLRSAWELSRFGTPPDTSSELVEEHLRRTEVLLKTLPEDPVFPARPKQGRLRNLGALAAVWAVGLPWLGPHPFGRVLAPWRDVPLESLLALEPGNARALWGSAVKIEARWKERPPAGLARPELELRQENGPWQAAPWDPESSRFVYTIASLTSPVEYRARHKDLRSAAYRLTPVPFPRFTELSARLHLPGARSKSRELKLEAGAELAALQGSWVILRGKPDRPLTSARMVVSYQAAPSAMEALPGGEWEGSFRLSESGVLRLELESEDGMRDPDPVPFPLRALEDKPPSVELLSPAFDAEISPKERLPVAFEARDDYGLSRISLLVRVKDGPETEIPVRTLDSPLEFLGDSSLDLSRFPAGAEVELRVKASDTASPRPQSALSAAVTLHLRDFEGMHLKARTRWMYTQAALDMLAQREDIAQKHARLMAQSGPDKMEEYSRIRSGLEEVLEKDWDRASSSLEELSKVLAEDPYANPGMSEAAKAASQAVSEMRSGEFGKAKEAGRSGEHERAAGLHQALKEKVGRTSELLKEGREAQAFQDFWNEAQRMDQAGGELSGKIERMAQAGKTPGAEELKELQEAFDSLKSQMEALARSIESLPKAEPGSSKEKNRKVFVVPLRQAASTMNALQRALAAGDFAQAARLAKKLSEDLAKVRQSIADAARAQAAESPGEKAARKMDQALGLWRDVVEGQTRSLQMTQGLEEQRAQALRRGQEKLLKEMAQAQAEAVRDAEKPETRAAPETVGLMKQALKEFENSQVAEAPRLLEDASLRLRAQAAAHGPPSPESGRPSPPREALTGAEALADLAAREDALREKLREGASAPPLSEAELSERMASAAVQGQVKRKTAELGERLEEVSRETGLLPQQTLESVYRAQGEQGAAEQALGRGDTKTAQGRQERALELLEQGLKGMEDSQKQCEGLSQSAAAPFSRERALVRPSGGRGRTGTDTGFVPLPKSGDYRPPQEIRREVERSIQEKRPELFDGVIKDYLRRMSQ